MGAERVFRCIDEWYRVVCMVPEPEVIAFLARDEVSGQWCCQILANYGGPDGHGHVLAVSFSDVATATLFKLRYGDTLPSVFKA